MKSGLLSTNQKQNAIVTMSSREIAALTRLRHSNVCRTIQDLMERQVIGGILKLSTPTLKTVKSISARAWAEQFEKRQLAEQQAALMKPKADFVDHYIEVGTSKSLRETAKILNMPEKAMIAALERDKVLYRHSGNLVPYSDKQSRGLFTVKTGTAEHGHNFTQTRVTAKGIRWIADRYASELML